MPRKNVTYPNAYGFVLIYRNSYNEIRSMVLDVSTLREAFDVVNARGISLKDIIAISKIAKLEMQYKKDYKDLTKNFGLEKGKT